jgi:hypothetical protein
MSVKIKYFFQKFLIPVFIFIGLCLPTLQVYAISSSSGISDCNEVTQLTVVSLLKPTNFVPLVPASCAKDGSGAKALSLGSLPIIIVRAYGLIASTVFFLFGLNFIAAAVRYSYGAFQEGESSKALQTIQESGVSVGLVLTAHIIVSTLFSTIFNIPLQTDTKSLQAFFN